jgi:hypothetical protein
MKFPREMWAGSLRSNAREPARIIVQNKEDYNDFIKMYNGKMNVFTSVYDYEYFSENRGLEYSVILDRIFLDFDAHDGDLEEAHTACYKMHNWLMNKNYKHTIAFSGRGFHIFVYGKRTHSLRQIKAFFDICRDVVHGSKSLDDLVINTSRLRRVQNTYHLGAKRYCIPIDNVDMLKGLDWILDISDRPSRYEPTYYGEKLLEWPEVKSMETVEIEIDSVESPGELPILPCLKNAIMVENPNHRARVLLVQWYNEILSELAIIQAGEDMKPRDVSGGALEMIARQIECEIEIIADNEDVWIDYNRITTRGHVDFIVNNRYMAPSCNTLINEGLCVGKCWRYGHDSN